MIGNLICREMDGAAAALVHLKAVAQQAEAGDRQAVNGPSAMNGMSAGNDGACLINLVVAAPQQLPDRVGAHRFGQAEDIERQLGFTAHGIDAAQSLGRGNLPI